MTTVIEEVVIVHEHEFKEQHPDLHSMTMTQLATRPDAEWCFRDYVEACGYFTISYYNLDEEDLSYNGEGKVGENIDFWDIEED